MRKLFILVAAGLLFAGLTACGGGGSNTTATDTSNNGNNNNNVTALHVTGTAATGSPIIGGTITIKDANGTTKTGTTDSTGKFDIDVTGLVAPFIGKIDFTDATGTAKTLLSYTANPAAGTMNINPLSNVAVITASGTTTPATLFTSLTSAQQTAIKNNIAAAIATMQTKMLTILTQYQANTTDPITGSYSVGTGIDRVFDVVDFKISGTTLTMTNKITNTVLATTSISNMANMTISSATLPQTALDMTITSMSTTTGETGSHLVITGTGFDNSLGVDYENIVLIGGVRTYMYIPSPNRLEVIIPPGVTSGNVAVIRYISTMNQTEIIYGGNYTVTTPHDYMIFLAGLDTSLNKLNIYGMGFITGANITINQNGNVIPINSPTVTIGSDTSKGIVSSISVPIPAALDTTSNFTITVTNGTKSSMAYTVHAYNIGAYSDASNIYITYITGLQLTPSFSVVVKQNGVVIPSGTVTSMNNPNINGIKILIPTGINIHQEYYVSVVNGTRDSNTTIRKAVLEQGAAFP